MITGAHLALGWVAMVLARAQRSRSITESIKEGDCGPRRIPGGRPMSGRTPLRSPKPSLLVNPRTRHLRRGQDCQYERDNEKH